MTPNDQEDPAKSEELLTTELYPFAPVTPGGLDETLPDLPAMEELPDSQAFPDPCYPEMPALAGEHAADAAPPASPPGPREPPPGPEPHGPADGPGARSWPLPPGPLTRPAFQPFPPPPDVQPPRLAPLPHPAPPPLAGEAPKQVWSADPYAPPR